MNRLAVPLVGLLLSATAGAGGTVAWSCVQCRDAHEVSVLPRLDDLSSCATPWPEPSVRLSDGCPVSGRLP